MSTCTQLDLESLGLYFFIFFFISFISLRQKADMPTPKHERQLTTWQVFYQVERRFHGRNQIANLFLEIWVSLHHHPEIWVHLGLYMPKNFPGTGTHTLFRILGKVGHSDESVHFRPFSTQC